MLKRIGKIVLWGIGVIVLVLVGLLVYIYSVARVEPPIPPAGITVAEDVVVLDTGLYREGPNWFRQSESGLYEMYVEGSPYQRGVAIGLLTKNLAQYQEKVFTDQINRMVPSPSYLRGLKYFIGWFNRDLVSYVPEEYRLEIYGVSQSSSHAYDYIAEPYQRILNYHAAHDIGHALQNMSLVGCTSFAAWDSDAEDGQLTIGRNFDFYVGDDFARNKIIAFYNPSEGQRFMMITFAGMVGVMSGMNTAGLTVTINAAKSDIPSAAATPVSLVAREILQYATTIDEAYAIAAKRKMFVAESFLIGSAKDGRAAIIEKNVDTIGLYAPQGTHIVCTNHFQSDVLGNTPLNQEHIATSASAYRYARVEELLQEKMPMNVEKTVDVLRDQRGLHNADIGLGNEKAINQLIAHHGIVFQPASLRVWVSTAPWQLGKFVCYDLNKVFEEQMMTNHEIYEPIDMIAADSFLLTKAYRDFVKMSRYRFPFAPRDNMNPDSVIQWNQNSYLSYMLAGDYFFEEEKYARAKTCYENALTKEIATVAERKHIEEHLSQCKQALQ